MHTFSVMDNVVCMCTCARETHRQEEDQIDYYNARAKKRATRRGRQLITPDHCKIVTT